MTDEQGLEPSRRRVAGSPTFLAASRIDEERADVSFADALLLARLVLGHRGVSMPTRGKKAFTTASTAKRLARLGLASLDEGMGRKAGSRDRSAWTIRASTEGESLVRAVLGLDDVAPDVHFEVHAQEQPFAEPVLVRESLAETLPFDDGWAREGVLPFEDEHESESESHADSESSVETNASAGRTGPVTDRGVEHAPDEDASMTNRRAEDLWGLPDAAGRYLTSIVVHGDDMSEEDDSRVIDRLLGALNMAARNYGEEPAWDPSRSIVGNDWDNPLVAALTDGTLIAARSTSRRGRGNIGDTPTPQEHASWAGLPIPPEPPPPPPPPPSIINVVWDRVTQHEGETFTLIRGGHFTYTTTYWTVEASSTARRTTRFERHLIGNALAVWPVSGPSGLLEHCWYGTSYIWALLADDRILGLRDPGTGALGVGEATGTDPYSPAAEWLTWPQPTVLTAPVRVEDLFNPTPDGWGRRGDPVLWELLRSRWEDTPVPDSPTDLHELLAGGFQKIVGVDAFDRNAPESVYVDELAAGGAFSGHVHIATWRDLLLPVLVGRSISRSN